MSDVAVVFCYWHASLRLHSSIRRQRPPQRAVLSQIFCFGERKVVVSQILLDGAQPRDSGTLWLYSVCAVCSDRASVCMCVIFSTSVEYSRTSSYKGTRLMALCDVALGQCHDTFRYDVTLTRPPDDYDSVHGVKCSEDVLSDFKV